jgi:carboxylesterase
VAETGAAPSRESVRRRRLPRGLIAALLIVLLVVPVLLFRPATPITEYDNPQPAASFEESHERLRKIWETEATDVIPVCKTKALLNGKKTSRVILFLHGYTSCPEQFAQLAEYFVRDGINVLIPLLPHHGRSDRMTREHSDLTTQELIAYSTQMVDIARGLGDTVVVAGLSAGGLIAGWIAQRRSDVHLAALISPVLGYTVIPHYLSLAAARFYSVWPDEFDWWDPNQKETAGPSYSYPWYSRRALARMLYFGNALIAEARSGPPQAKRVLFVRNPSDNRISAEGIDALLSNWKLHSNNVSTYVFPSEMGLGHDLIDPNLPTQKVDLVYPKLYELLSKG